VQELYKKRQTECVDTECEKKMDALIDAAQKKVRIVVFAIYEMII